MSANLTPLFSKGINENILFELMEAEPTYSRVFHTTETNSPYLDDFTWELYGLPRATQPMEPVYMDSFRPSFSKRYVLVKYTIGDAIAKEYMDYDQYGLISRVVPSRAGALARAYIVRREYACANFLGVLGFQSGTNVPGMADGVALFSTQHPISLSNMSTTWSNRPSTDADLSHATYNVASAALLQQMAPNNVTILSNPPAQLIVNPNIRHVAYQIAQGNWERGTNNFNMNVGVRDNIEVVVWPYFRASGATGTYNAWVLLGQHHFLKYVANPRGIEIDTDYDIRTQAYLFVSYCLEDVGASDARGTYGSKGA